MTTQTNNLVVANVGAATSTEPTTGIYQFWRSNAGSQLSTNLPTSEELSVIAQNGRASGGNELDKTLTIKRSNTINQISPTLAFKFVKSKFTKIEKEKLKKRFRHLSSLLKYSKDMDQWAMYEEASRKIIETTLEQEAEVIGANKVILKKDVEKFINIVKDKVIKFKNFSEFPRIVPNDVQEKYKSIKEKNVFDEFLILYTDFTKPEDKIKSNKEKIKEKDPILFGKFNRIPDKLYWIADWQDEHCDLSLDKIVEQLEKLDKNYKIEILKELTPDKVNEIKMDIIAREMRLRETNAVNYKDLMKKEDQERNKKQKLSLLSIFKNVFKKGK